MSFAGPVHLLNPEVKENFNIKLLKKHSVSHEKRKNILLKLVYMATFEDISKWVEIHSNGQKFIANPSNASDTDRLDCLFAVQTPLALALKDVEKRRKNGRDSRLLGAAETGDYAKISDVLASAAASYWRDHGFFNSSKDLKTASFLKNDEKNIEKKDLKKAQLERVGAAIDLKKTRKKRVFQVLLDFEETDKILKNKDFED